MSKIIVIVATKAGSFIGEVDQEDLTAANKRLVLYNPCQMDIGQLGENSQKASVGMLDLKTEFLVINGDWIARKAPDLEKAYRATRAGLSLATKTPPLKTPQ